MSDKNTLTMFCPAVKQAGNVLIAPEDQLVIGLCAIPSGPVSVAVSSISHQELVPVPKQKQHAVRNSPVMETQVLLELIYPADAVYGKTTQLYRTGKVFLTLEQLLRQFDLTPFVPVYNEKLAKLVGENDRDFFWQVLQSVRLQSIEDQPGSIAVQLQLFKSDVESVAGGQVLFKDVIKDSELQIVKQRMYESDMIYNMIADKIQENLSHKQQRLIVDWNAVVNQIKVRLETQFSTLWQLQPQDQQQTLKDLWYNYQQQVEQIQRIMNEVGAKYDLGTVIEFEAQMQSYLQPHRLLQNPSVFHQYMGQSGWQLKLTSVTTDYDALCAMQKFRQLVGELVIIANELVSHVPVEVKWDVQSLLDIKYPFILNVDVQSVDDQPDTYLVSMSLADTTFLYELERMTDVQLSAQNAIINKAQNQRLYLAEDLKTQNVDTDPNSLAEFTKLIQTPNRTTLDQVLDRYMTSLARVVNEKLFTIQLAGQLLDFSAFDKIDTYQAEQYATLHVLTKLLSRGYDERWVADAERLISTRAPILRQIYQAILAVEMNACNTKPEQLNQIQLNQSQPENFSTQVAQAWLIRSRMGEDTFDSILSYSIRYELASLVQDLVSRSAQILSDEKNDSAVLQGLKQNVFGNQHSKSVLNNISKTLMKGLAGDVREAVLHQQYCNYLRLIERILSDRYSQQKFVLSMVDDVDTFPTLPNISRFGRFLNDQAHFLTAVVEVLMQIMTEDIKQFLENIGVLTPEITQVPYQLDINLSDIFAVQYPERYAWVYEVVQRQAEVAQDIKTQLRSRFPGSIGQVLGAVSRSKLTSAKLLQLMDLVDETGSNWDENVIEKYGQGKEPVANDVSVFSNIPPNVDVQKFEQVLNEIQSLDYDVLNRQSKLGLQSVLNNLRQSLNMSQNMLNFRDVIALNSQDYSTSILYEQMYNLLTTQHNIDHLTPNAQVLFIYRHHIQPMLFPHSTAVITYNSIQKLEVIKQRDNPIHLANLVLTNMTGVIDPSSAVQLASYRKDSSVPHSVQRLFLKPGVEIAIRLGYGRNTAGLPIVFQGFIQAIQQTNDLVQITAEGYGALLTRQLFEQRKRIGGLQSNPVELVYQALDKAKAPQLGYKDILERVTQTLTSQQMGDLLVGSYFTKRLLPILRSTDQTVNVYQPTEYYKGFGPDPYGVFQNFETYFCEYNAQPGDSQWKLIRDQVDMMPGYVVGFVDYGIGQQRLFYGRPFDPAKFTATPQTSQQLSVLLQRAKSVQQLELKEIELTIDNMLKELKELPRLAVRLGTSKPVDTKTLLQWYTDVKAELQEMYNRAKQSLQSIVQHTSAFDPKLLQLLERLSPNNFPFFNMDPRVSEDSWQLKFIYNHSPDPRSTIVLSQYCYCLRKLQEAQEYYSTDALAQTRQQIVYEETLKQIDESQRSAIGFWLFSLTRKSLQFRDIYNRQVILGTKPYQSLYPISSHVNLLDNTVGLDRQNIANEVVLYSAPFFQDWFFLIRFVQWIGNFLTGFEGITKFNGKNYTVTKILLDEDIPEEYRLSAVAVANYAEVLQQKVLVGTSILMRYMRNMYTGELVILGHQPLKTDDRILLHDSVNNMQGLQVVGTVIHRFDVPVGFITTMSIEPEMEVRDLHVSSLKQLAAKQVMVGVQLTPFIIAQFGGGVGQITIAFQLTTQLKPVVNFLVSRYINVGPKFSSIDSESTASQISLERVVNPILIKPLVKSGLLYFQGMEGAKFADRATGISGMINDAAQGIQYFTEGLQQFGQLMKEGWKILTNQIDIWTKDMITAKDVYKSARDLITR